MAVDPRCLKEAPQTASTGCEHQRQALPSWWYQLSYRGRRVCLILWGALVRAKGTVETIISELANYTDGISRLVKKLPKAAASR